MFIGDMGVSLAKQDEKVIYFQNKEIRNLGKRDSNFWDRRHITKD